MHSNAILHFLISTSLPLNFYDFHNRKIIASALNLNNFHAKPISNSSFLILLK